MTVRLTMNRRMFLRGAAGGALAIPFLPSILRTGIAKAATEAPRCFIALQCEHGGMRRSRFFPDDSTATSGVSLGALSWQARHGRLVRTESGGRARLSEILEADASVLTPRMVDSMNALCGLDYSRYAGHNICYALGAYATELRNYETQEHWGPGIDQLIAYSKSFYGQLPEGGPVAPLPLVQYGPSVGHLLPGNPSSPVGLPPSKRSNQLWNELFQPGGSVRGGGDPDVERALRIEALNDTHAAYQRLQSRASSPGSRLSADDRDRLDRHMDAVSRMRRHLEAAAGCGVAGPAADPVPTDTGRIRADLVRSAIECGISRVFNFSVLNTNLIDQDVIDRYGGTHELIHQSSDGTEQNDWWHLLYQRIFEHEVLPMAQALDFQDSEGRNVLDHSLILWTSEAGFETHQSKQIPVVTFGSGDGAFSTGNFIDYRGPVDPDKPDPDPDHRWGLVYDQLLGTILRGFEVDVSEYDHYRGRPAGSRGSATVAPEGAPVVGGYGAYSALQVENTKGFYHDSGVHRFADTPLPVFWNR